MQKFKSVLCNILNSLKTFYMKSAKIIKPVAAFLYNVLSKFTVILSHIIKKSWAASVIIFFSMIDAVVYLNEVNVIIDQMLSSLLSSTFFVFYKFIEFICIKVTDSIVWTYNLICRWKREKFTFVIISHENSNQKNIRLSKLFVYSGTFAVSFATGKNFICKVFIDIEKNKRRNCKEECRERNGKSAGIYEKLA